MNSSKGLQIEEMDSMRVARVAIECENPEIAAFRALIEWATRNEPEPPDRVRFFGFNDPCPAPGQTVYEYEAWMTVSEKAREQDRVSIVVHPGQTYAVISTPLLEIGEAWVRLGEAVKNSEYEFGSGPALEEAMTHPLSTPFEKAQMKLYLPVQKTR